MAEAHTSPPLEGVLETSLYVADFARARGFYEGVMGLQPLFADERLTAYAAGPHSVLLLFLCGTTEKPAATPGGTIPPHEGSGRLHYAFAVTAEALPAWEARLGERGVPVESRVSWPRGAQSIYFRDPDGNLVELATPGLWRNS